MLVQRSVGSISSRRRVITDVFFCCASAFTASTTSLQPHSVDTNQCVSSTSAMSSSFSDNGDRAWGKIETVPNNNNNLKVSRLFMKDDGVFPNNQDHPVLLFQDAFHETRRDAEQLIVQNGWTAPWAWGIFSFHHYHSTAWELLVCVRGQATVQLGGETGPSDVVISKGDVVLIPPGFAHKQLSSTGGFTLLGSYPLEGCSGPVDTLRGAPTEQERRNIATCAVPPRDPIFDVELSKLY